MTGPLLALMLALLVIAAAVGFAAYSLACALLGDPSQAERLQSAVDRAYCAAHEFMDEPHVAVVVMLERLEDVVTPEDPRDIWKEARDAGDGERCDWGEGRGRRWLRAQR